LKLIIEGWKTYLLKINNINENHFFALHIHEQKQYNEHNTSILEAMNPSNGHITSLPLWRKFHI
jgi:hypothetical protein